MREKQVTQNICHRARTGVCLVPEACGAFNSEWHDNAVAMLNGPQIAAGHSAKANNTGLYFCEVATVDGVEAALRHLQQTTSTTKKNESATIP